MERAAAVGEIQPVRPVKLFCGMIAADGEVMLRAREALARLYGAVDLESEPIPFDFTDYYQEEMGGGLVRKLIAFDPLIDPGRLAEIKVRTNDLERKLAATPGGRRRVNLDPGYVDASKLVLATTKALAHRVYVGRGIYAEVTLTFRKKGCAYFDWTYPDYRSGRYTAFLLEIRRRYMESVRNLESGKALG